MEVIAQIFVDFVTEYGVLAAVVFAMLYNDRKKSKEQSENMQSMLRNQAEESKQQGQLISVLQSQATGISDIAVGFGEFKKDIIKKADDISILSSKSRDNVHSALNQHTATMEKNTESVTNMNEQFKTLEQAIREVLDKVQGGMTLDEKTKNEIIAEVSKNISNTVHECMEKAIKSTQETPIIKPETTIIEKPKPLREKTEHEESNQPNPDTTG
jgi:hypothetical protein